MSSKKSSITAEVKVAGLAKFKSDLGSVGTAAKKAGKEISSIRPPDLVMTPVYQYWEARKRGEKMLTAATKAEAEKRAKIEEQSAARSAMAMRTIIGNLRARPLMAPEINRMSGGGQWGHLSGTQFAGGTRGGSGGGGGGRSGYGSSAGYGLSVGYNAIQDLAQGGPAAIANNIPQIVQLVADSPALKNSLAGAAVAATALFIGNTAYKLYQQSSFVGEMDRNRTEYQTRKVTLDEERESEKKARNSAFSELNANRYVRDLEGTTKAQQSRPAFNVNYTDRQLKFITEENLKISRGNDERINAEKLAAKEKERLEKKIIDDEIMISQEKRAAQSAYSSASSRLQTVLNEIARFEEKLANQQKLSDRETDRLSYLRGVVAAEEAATAVAKERRDNAVEEDRKLFNRKEELPAEKRKIDEQLAYEVAEFDKAAKEKNAKIVRDFERAKMADRFRKENDKFEKDKAKQAEADSLTEKESMSRMTPRKLEKYQKEKRMEEEKKRLVGLGFDPETAASMAERGEKLNERAAMDQMNPRRIRGAGYAGQKDTRATGLGTSTFEGLAELSAMQGDNMPGAPSAGRGIKGAGYKEPKQKNDGVSIARPDPLTSLLVKGLAAIEKAVRETGPSSNDRAKPLSTANR